MVIAKSAFLAVITAILVILSMGSMAAKGKHGQVFDNKAPFKTMAPKIKAPKIYKPKKIKKAKSKF